MKSQVWALLIVAALFSLTIDPALARGGGGGGGGGGGHAGGGSGGGAGVGHAGAPAGHSSGVASTGRGRGFGISKGFFGGGRYWGDPGYYGGPEIEDDNLPPPGQDLDNYRRKEDARRAGLSGQSAVRNYGRGRASVPAER
jgi:hypothetical protein